MLIINISEIDDINIIFTVRFHIRQLRIILFNTFCLNFKILNTFFYENKLNPFAGYYLKI